MGYQIAEYRVCVCREKLAGFACCFVGKSCRTSDQLDVTKHSVTAEVKLVVYKPNRRSFELFTQLISLILPSV